MAAEVARLRPGDDNVFPLGTKPPPEPEPEVTRPTALHGLAIAGIALFAFTGIAALFLFVTVEWTDDARRVVGAAFFLSGVGLVASLSTAVFTAARDTYATGRRAGDGSDRPA